MFYLCTGRTSWFPSWTRSTHSMPPSSKRPDNYFTAAPTTHWRPCPASSSSSVTCVRVVGGIGAWAARSRLHQPAMDLKDQTKFRDIPWTREGSAGGLLVLAVGGGARGGGGKKAFWGGGR